MSMRAILIGAAGALALTACDKQPAGPYTDLTFQSTGVLNVQLSRDTANTLAQKLLPAAGVTVSLFPLTSPTLLLRNATTDSRGIASFTGLAPGKYIVTPQVRAGSAFQTFSSDTVTVSANGTTSSRPFVVRLGSSVSGTIAAEFLNQSRFVSQRFQGVVVSFFRELVDANGVPTGVFSSTPFATATTDVTGAFSIPVAPGPARVRATYDASALFSNDSLLLGGAGTIPTPRGLTIGTTGAIAPDASVSLTSAFTYTFKSSLTGIVFRDYNNNGVRDAGDTLAVGDTIRVQLRDSTGTRVITTVTATRAAPRYTLKSIQGGKYQLVIDLPSSRFGDTFPLKPGTKTYVVIVPNSASVVTQDIAVPLTP